MFEQGRQYANRTGRYTVVEIGKPKMTVQYEDGAIAELNMGIQNRIWENILVEEEVRHTRSGRVGKRRGLLVNKFFVRTVGVNEVEGLFMKGWKEQASAADIVSKHIARGDRLIYFAIEGQRFFTVATITSDVNVASAKTLDDDQDGGPVVVFSVDIDAQALALEKGVALNSIEFESQSDIKTLLNQQGSYVSITEDEF
ncbi:MAG: hypothetical protein JRJ87_27725, partial [Deltaproteobacteria bacterium]|nr:hypothetical protein [Deltaproteobacteria bacterium]